MVALDVVRQHLEKPPNLCGSGTLTSRYRKTWSVSSYAPGQEGL